MKRLLTPILLVEADARVLAFLRQSLGALGITDVETAADGAEAVALLEAETYGLIIADWHLPTMGGLQLLRHVRGREHLAHIPFMIITGETQVDIVLTARQAGADAVALKPFGVQVLRTKIIDVAKQRPRYAAPVMPPAVAAPLWRAARNFS